MDRDAMIATLMLHGFEPVEVSHLFAAMWNAERRVLVYATHLTKTMYCRIDRSWASSPAQINANAWDNIPDRFLTAAIERIPEIQDDTQN